MAIPWTEPYEPLSPTAFRKNLFKARPSEAIETAQGVSRPFTNPEKQSIILVLLGTFLEYFDLILYVHLAVILNPLFFPTDDPVAAGLLGALTFSSAYILRPVGSLFFGYIGDKIGRKTPIVYTSALMGLAALTIACLPVHASIGFTASLLFILARSMQGFASIGEMIGAQVFLVEISEPSLYRHLISTLMVMTLLAGILAALSIGLICLHLDPLSGWHWPFLVGASVTLIGGVIRLRVIESPAFIALRDKKRNPSTEDTLHLLKLLRFRHKNYWCYFGIEAVTPLTLYFCFRYGSDFLKQHLGCSATEIMTHNLEVSVLWLMATLFCGWLSLHHDPLTLLKRRLLLGLLSIPPLLFLLALFPEKGTLFGVEILLLSLLAQSANPAQFLIVRSFPIIGRCSNVGSAYALSHATMYVVTSLLIFGADWLGGLRGIGALFMITALVSWVCALWFETGEKDSLAPFASSS